MSYGFDAYVLVPPYSLVVSVLLLLACDMVGNIFLRTFKLKLHIGSWVRLQAPLFGLMLLAILVYSMALMGFATLSNLRFISSLLIIMLGAHFILRLAKIKLSRDVKYIVNYGKNILATSTVQDFLMSFTVKNIVSEAVVTDRGALYGVGDPLVMDTNANIGNGLAEARIDNINQGVVSGISIDDAGSAYKVGDVLTFTTTDSNTISPAGFVSIIEGSIALNGTSVYYTDNNARRIDEDDFIILEENTNRHLEFFEIELELHTTGTSGQSLLLNGTDGSSTNAGHKIGMEWSIYQYSPDTYGTDADRWVLEEQTAVDLGYGSGTISRVHLKSKGGGFLTIPTVAVTGSVSGTGAAVLVTTDNIGSAGDIIITNEGFNYNITSRTNIVSSYKKSCTSTRY
jgi:hypothetical protein